MAMPLRVSRIRFGFGIVLKSEPAGKNLDMSAKLCSKDCRRFASEGWSRLIG
jgi:hypothetical protein